jgi:transcription elongation factor Elf1
MNSFCPFCEKTTPSKVIDAVVAHSIKGVEVTVNAKLVQCDECGGQFNGPELDQDVAAMALNAYREKVGLLKPEQIREFRATFDLNAAGARAASGLGHDNTQSLRERRDPG